MSLVRARILSGLLSLQRTVSAPSTTQLFAPVARRNFYFETQEEKYIRRRAKRKQYFELLAERRKMEAKAVRQEKDRLNKRLRGTPRDELEVRISKTLSWVLRHGAKKEGLFMRPDGYVRVKDLVRPFKGSQPEIWDLYFTCA